MDDKENTNLLNLTLFDIEFYKIPIEKIKPYVIVCGVIGIGKTSYINAMKQYDERKYFEVQNIMYVSKLYRDNADQIIEIRNIKEVKE